jgi:hypothetical protein
MRGILLIGAALLCGGRQGPQSPTTPVEVHKGVRVVGALDTPRPPCLFPRPFWGFTRFAPRPLEPQAPELGARQEATRTSGGPP